MAFYSDSGAATILSDPWSCRFYTTKFANSKDTLEIAESISKEGKFFLSLCLKHDPAKRPSATHLLGHPFVHDHQATTSAEFRKSH